MIYSRFGLHKVNRAARHSFFADAYRSHRLRMLAWSVFFFGLFVWLFLALMNAAIHAGVNALMGR